MTTPADHATPDANIARHLARMAAAQPAVVALKIPCGRMPDGRIDYLALTFAELDAEVAAWTARLAAAGLRPGDRTLLMVRPGLPLIAVAFALFRLGAVPVVIDPGMGLKNFLACVARSRPRALVGIPFAQILSHLFRPTFATVKIRIPARSSLTARLSSASEIINHKSEIVPSPPADLAAILFTSGSTGAPKGVRYHHGHFDAQVRLLRDAYGIRPGEIDLPLLPIFALFNPALGLTTIIPELDPRRPATLDPAKIVQAILQENVTTSFGSPTLWKKIGDHCLAHRITLPTLRRVLCAGAPVPATLWRASRTFLPHGQLHSPYGATEALPVATISAVEIAALAPAQISNPEISLALPATAVAASASPGACVGRPLPGITVKIIAPADAPLATLADTRELPPGEIGEIIVAGPVVTAAYDALPEATARAKISDAPPLQPSSFNLHPSPVWHRLGDCGYLDAEGRLWFVGRQAERVETPAGTLHTEPCEQVFRAHPRVTRCALIGLGDRATRRQIPALVVEAAPASPADALALARELRALALQHAQTAALTHFFFNPAFPVDVRHNAKIHRLTLAKWAAAHLDGVLKVEG